MQEQFRMINRPKYINELKKWSSQRDLVKILTGVRRCGKSVIFKLFQSYLQRENGVLASQIIDINLEDPIFAKKIGLEMNQKNMLVGYDKLLGYILNKVSDNGIFYVFIDEVQLLEHWQQLANSLRLKTNIDLYLTGSNAYMFSSDLANSFGGRYVKIFVQPFSFQEFCSAYTILEQFRKKSKTEMLVGKSMLDLYQSYITESGFPQTVNFFGDKGMINKYLLDTVYENTIQKDIINRFNIDKYKLDIVTKFLFDNIGNKTSLRNIEKSLKADNKNVSVPTISNYIQGLVDSYLIYKCDPFDLKGKQILKSESKYYVVDLCLRNIIVGNSDKDMGHILENVVYLELINRGYTVYCGKLNKSNKDLEIDFIAQKNGQETKYFQVALNIMNPETLNRELLPLESLKDNYPKYILSMDLGNSEINGIKRLNVLDWLLNTENDF